MWSFFQYVQGYIYWGWRLELLPLAKIQLSWIKSMSIWRRRRYDKRKEKKNDEEEMTLKKLLDDDIIDIIL